MVLDMVSWMGGAIFSALVLGGALGYALLGETITEAKQSIVMDDEEQWTKLLNKKQ